MVDKRCIFLAVDGAVSRNQVYDTIGPVANGPVGSYLAGIKFNDALHIAGISGPALVGVILDVYPEMGVCLDLKLADVSATDENIMTHYAQCAKRLLATVSIHSSIGVFRMFHEKFPEIKLICMGVPTDISEKECLARYGSQPSELMVRWYSALSEQFQRAAGINDRPTDLAVMSYEMVPVMRSSFSGLDAFTPGIRDEWMRKDHQERTTGVRAALEAGVRYVVMGSQLTKGNPSGGVSAQESQERTAQEIEAFFA